MTDEILYIHPRIQNGSGSFPYVGNKPSLGSSLTLKITVSLACAVQHIRDATEPITLWVDQICINQSDVTKKGSQVAAMRSIWRGRTGAHLTRSGITR